MADERMERILDYMDSQIRAEEDRQRQEREDWDRAMYYEKLAEEIAAEKEEIRKNPNYLVEKEAKEEAQRQKEREEYLREQEDKKNIIGCIYIFGILILFLLLKWAW